ncbi:MAG: hypothetical protein HZA36_01315 [Parcubacteria group bacterium]|nr:hypothetical protein [Parcubacteria group bacterium]
MYKKFFVILTTFIFLHAYGVNAAEDISLFISPSRDTVYVGDIVSVRIMVSSPDKDVNAVSGVLSYPKDILEFVSISKVGSRIVIWPEEPSLRSVGRVGFEGVIINPVFRGKNGTVLTVKFKARSVGEAMVDIGSGTVLANDGVGTDVLSVARGALFTVLPPRSPQTPLQQEGIEVPIIHSPTHPDHTVWYANNNPQFEWTLPPSASSVYLSINKDPQGTLGVTPMGPITTSMYHVTEDGQWYFHMQFRTKEGRRSGVAHFPFRVDTTPPQGDGVYISEVIKEHVMLGSWRFVFSAKDGLSGIERYEVSIDKEKGVVQYGGGEHTYRARGLFFGTHILTIRAFDHAGNVLVHSIKFGTLDDVWILIFLCVCIGVFLWYFLKRYKKDAGINKNITNTQEIV